MTIVISAHYRVINPTCTYCNAPSTIVRVTVTDGLPLIATMCDEHAKGEAEASASDELVNDPGTGDFYRPIGKN